MSLCASHCTCFDWGGQKSVKKHPKTIKNHIKKHYLGDGLLSYVFRGGVWSCFSPVSGLFLLFLGPKSGQSAADV